MSIVKLTGPAFFYVAMSSGLSHGHGLWFEYLEVTADGFVLVDLPIVGSVDCRADGWNEEAQEVVLGVREVDLLHQLQGRIVNREAMKGAIAGLEGWEVSGDYRRKVYSHRTATGRLRLSVVSETYHHSDGGSEEIWIEVCAGDGKTVAAIIWRKAGWHKWYGQAQGMHGGSDDLPIAVWLANHNTNHRPDRFHTLADMLFDGDGNCLLPGESLADVEHWGVGAAIKACLSGTAFEIADKHKADDTTNRAETYGEHE